MSSSPTLCCFPLEKKQKHDVHFFFRSMYNKTIIRFGFCDIQNNQGLGKGYKPQPSATANNPYLELAGLFWRSQKPHPLIVYYWIRLSRIWEILQIKEGVTHRGRRTRLITPSQICRILHILRKSNSMIALYSFKIFPRFQRSFAISLFVFLLTKKATQSRPQIFSVLVSIICNGLHF